MNKKFPYEEALKRQMYDIELPNEEDAWQNMKGLLDESDKRKPFAYFKKYATLSLAIILFLIGIGLLVFRKTETKEKPFAGNDIRTHSLPVTKGQNKTESNFSKGADSRYGHSDKVNYNPADLAKVKRKAATADITKENSLPTKRLKDNNKTSQSHYSNTDHKSAEIVAVDGIKTSNNTNQNPSAILLSNAPLSSIENHSQNLATTAKTETSDSLLNQQKAAEDTKAGASAEEISTVKKELPTNDKRFIVSAGMGLQQQIPVSGQKAVSVGYNATRNTLSDYIPFVFVRLEKDHQWFLQAEYVYARPQQIRQFSYYRQTLVNNSAGTIITTDFWLRKTFYNQIPVSFNYYINHNWSAGFGGVYNIFHGAISEKEVTTNNVLTQVQAVTKQIVPISGYIDSFLYKSHVNLLLQMDYNWSRLSLGLRYSKDMEPYIKYITPDGTVTSQKNWALEFILRFKIFKTKKF
jgi:hypothetical protein